ncbi:MAG: hypothetical protein KAJ18_07500, partial [Candidatus Omnitrophica bacterium]|nr:hypothetical protein [Candidatus Omnitrophota bacterium]
MFRFKKNAQQFVEYLLVFAVTTIVFIGVIGPTGPVRNAVEQVLSLSFEQLETETANLVIDDPAPVGDDCGDGICSGVENCTDCSEDCDCPEPDCGNGVI